MWAASSLPFFRFLTRPPLTHTRIAAAADPLLQWESAEWSVRCFFWRDAERLVGLALSQGSAETLLKIGMTHQEIGLDELRDTANTALGGKAVPWYFSYRMRVGVK